MTTVNVCLQFRYDAVRPGQGPQCWHNTVQRGYGRRRQRQFCHQLQALEHPRSLRQRGGVSKSQRGFGFHSPEWRRGPARGYERREQGEQSLKLDVHCGLCYCRTDAWMSRFSPVEWSLILLCYSSINIISVSLENRRGFSTIAHYWHKFSFSWFSITIV